MPRASSQLVGFATSTIVLGFSAVLVVPAAVIGGGSSGWASIALGQSIGVFGAAVIGLGWAVTGPALVANIPLALAWGEYKASLVIRVMLAVVVGSVGLGLTTWLDPDSGTVTGLAYVAAAAVGLSSHWYLVGVRRAWLFFGCEAIPRTLATLAACVIMMTTDSLETGMIVLLAGTIVGVTFVTVRVRPRGQTGETLDLRVRFRKQLSGFTVGIVGTLYVTAPIWIAAGIPAVSLASFALVDKLTRQVTSGVAPILSVLQGWVPSVPYEEQARRRRMAAVFLVVGATTISLVIWLTSDLVFGFLGAGIVDVSSGLALPAAIFAGITFLERGLGRAVIVPLRGARALAVATALAAILGLSSACLLAMSMGAEGLVWGLTTGLIASILAQLGVWRRLTMTHGASDDRNGLARSVASKDGEH